jgi:colicin import membrane protein
LRVILLSNGDVKKVSIVKSSGNANFDRSASSAVYKAAPWPHPGDPKVAAMFKDFKFVFRPQ